MFVGKESKVKGLVRLEDIEVEVIKDGVDFVNKEISDLE